MKHIININMKYKNIIKMIEATEMWFLRKMLN